jgi:hypothetical protein
MVGAWSGGKVDGVAVVRHKGQQRFQAKWTVRMVEDIDPHAVYTRHIILGPPRDTILRENIQLRIQLLGRKFKRHVLV